MREHTEMLIFFLKKEFAVKFIYFLRTLAIFIQDNELPLYLQV